MWTTLNSSVQINPLFHRQDQRRRGVMAISEYRPFIRALFHFGPKLGVPATLVVPLGSEIEKGMLSRPGRVIVSCGSHLEEVRIIKHLSTFFFPWCQVPGRSWPKMKALKIWGPLDHFSCILRSFKGHTFYSCYYDQFSVKGWKFELVKL